MKKLFYYIGYMFGSFGACADRIFDAMDNGATKARENILGKYR